MSQGDYTIYVLCKDKAGNEACNVTHFSLDLDTEPPKVVRVYYDNGVLKIITDEEAECVYNTNYRIGCKFDFENATAMQDSAMTHIADWDPDATYYIKCKDRFGKKPGECSIIVKAYNID